MFQYHVLWLLILVWAGATDAWLIDEGLFIGSETGEGRVCWGKTQAVRGLVIGFVDMVGTG
jgi:hypothetical protein